MPPPHVRPPTAAHALVRAPSPSPSPGPGPNSPSPEPSPGPTLARYTCLLSASFGLSLVTLSFERLLLTVALFALLSLKAGREEGFLRDKHGERYRAYAADVPQFFPTLPAIKSFVLGSD